MIPTRWSSAVAILRRRLQRLEEDRRLLRILEAPPPAVDPAPDRLRYDAPAPTLSRGTVPAGDRGDERRRP